MAYDVAVIIGLTGIAFIFGYLALNLDRERHAILQFLFLSSCLWFIMYDFYAIREIARVDTSGTNTTTIQELMVGGYDVSMIIGIVFIFYMIILILQALFRYLEMKRRPKIETER